MAADERHATADLRAAQSRDDELQALLRRAPRTSFFALVSLLERLTPGAERVGGDGPPAAEAIRFRHDRSMGFPAGDISDASLRQAPVASTAGAGASFSAQREVVELVTTFLGLTGSVSPLPLHIAAEVAQDPGDPGVQQAFLDIFHHRLISLFYRLWARYQIAREHLAAGEDAWSPRIAALCGFDAYDASLWRPLPLSQLLRLAPLLCSGARTARTLQLALEVLLEDELSEQRPAVHIEQFTGTATRLDDSQRMKLGSATSVLGRSSVIGAHARDPASGFAVHLRLRREAELRDYMLGGRKLEQTRALVCGLLREPLDFDLHVELDAAGQGGFTLSSATPEPLGHRTWLRGRQAARRVSIPGVGSSL